MDSPALKVEGVQQRVMKVKDLDHLPFKERLRKLVFNLEKWRQRNNTIASLHCLQKICGNDGIKLKLIKNKGCNDLLVPYYTITKIFNFKNVKLCN